MSRFNIDPKYGVVLVVADLAVVGFYGTYKNKKRKENAKSMAYQADYSESTVSTRT